MVESLKTNRTKIMNPVQITVTTKMIDRLVGNFFRKPLSLACDPNPRGGSLLEIPWYAAFSEINNLKIVEQFVNAANMHGPPWRTVFYNYYKILILRLPGC